MTYPSLRSNHFALKLTILISLLLLGFASVIAQQNEGPPYIKSIFFGGGDYYIYQDQETELNDFLDGIDGLEQYQIFVNSHTDSIGSMEYNQWLSQMRSQSVLNILNKRGIPPETVSKKDFGEQNPDFKNSTWEGKLRNRRADVILMPPEN